MKEFIASDDLSSSKANVPLENVANTMFIGGLYMGTLSIYLGSDNDRKPFMMIYDTGSALTCVASKLCNDIGCKKAHQYDRHSSETFSEIGK